MSPGSHSIVSVLSSHAYAVPNFGTEKKRKKNEILSSIERRRKKKFFFNLFSNKKVKNHTTPPLTLFFPFFAGTYSKNFPHQLRSQGKSKPIYLQSRAIVCRLYVLKPALHVAAHSSSSSFE